MTSYSGMAARGREAALATNKGHRKVIAARVEYDEEPSNVVDLGTRAIVLPPYRTVAARLVGECGHTLRWLASVPVHDGAPMKRDYLDGQVGKRMTCPHCIIPPKPPREPREDDCTWITSKNDEDGNPIRCKTRAKWDTEEGAVCTRHRDYLLREGYLTEPGTEITR